MAFPGWTLDPLKNLYYYFDSTEQCYIFDNGDKIPFPQSSSDSRTNVPPKENTKVFPGWLFDPGKNIYYYFNSDEQCYIYQNGDKVPVVSKVQSAPNNSRRPNDESHEESNTDSNDDKVSSNDQEEVEVDISRQDAIDLCTRRVRVVVKGNKFFADARLDSGADSNFISYDKLNKWDMRERMVDVDGGHTLTLADGTQGYTKGRIVLDWQIDASELEELFTTTFFVISGLQCDIIVGVHEAVKRKMIKFDWGGSSINPKDLGHLGIMWLNSSKKEKRDIKKLREESRSTNEKERERRLMEQLAASINSSQNQNPRRR